MRREYISDAIGNISTRHIREAENYEPAQKKSSFFKRPFGRTMVAAVLALCLFAGGIGVFSSSGGMAVTAYAYGTEEEITAAGAIMSTGTISDSGEMTGHPLMFFLAGEDIETVRFSCKNQQINFMDWTEKRDEFGNGQNFTVTYGEDENEYYFLLIDWVPNETIRMLKENEYSTIAALPAELREDVIVMEITFANGKTATRAITVTLRDDGTFFAAFDDYKITEADSFVQRTDSKAIPRDILYSQAELSVMFRDKDGDEVLPMALWYNFAGIHDIHVQWTGATPQSVRVYYTPSGTETLEQMELLEIKAPLDGDHEAVIVLPDSDVRDFYGHLQIDLDYGDKKISSDTYNVFYDEAAQQEHEMIMQAEQAARTYYEGNVFEVISMDLVDYTENGSVFSVCVSKGGVVQEPNRTIWLELNDGKWEVTNEGY